MYKNVHSSSTRKSPRLETEPSKRGEAAAQVPHTARQSDQWLGYSGGSQGGHAEREGQSQKAAQGSLHLCKDPNTTDGCAAKGEPNGLSGEDMAPCGDHGGGSRKCHGSSDCTEPHTSARTHSLSIRISSAAARKPASWWGCVSVHLTQTPTLGGRARTSLQDTSLQLPLDP